MPAKQRLLTAKETGSGGERGGKDTSYEGKSDARKGGSANQQEYNGLIKGEKEPNFLSKEEGLVP